MFGFQKLMPNILIVDDEEDIRLAISSKLESEGYATLLAANGLEGIQQAVKYRPDLIVLNAMMPDYDGGAMCRYLGDEPHTQKIPLIMLGPDDGVDQKIDRQDNGVAVYIAKPFSLEGLVLRIKSILKVSSDLGSESVIEVGPFHLDENSLKANVSGEDVGLTSTEFKLLLSLVKVPGVPKERIALLEEVLEYSSLSQTRTLDTHVKRLRAKLGKYGACIKTVRSVGYVFNELADFEET